MGSVACARPVIDSQISHPPALIGPDDPGAVDFCKTNNTLQVELEARGFFQNQLIYVVLSDYSVDFTDYDQKNVADGSFNISFSLAVVKHFCYRKKSSDK